MNGTMRRWTGLIGLSVMLAGCQTLQDWMPGQGGGEASQPPRSASVKRQVAFPAATYAKLDKRGTATVKGRLSYTTPQGRTVYGADETVSIAPATTYSAEAADVALSGRRIEPADPRAREYTHYAKTDSRGYFIAHGIPSGVFYVAGSVLLAEGQTRSPVIIKQVELRAGQTRTIDLSR